MTISVTNNMHTTDTSTPVVILVSGDHGPLGIARTVGRLGAPVSAIHSHSFTPCAFSRYCKRTYIWNLETNRPSDTVSFLQRVGQTADRRPVLIPTTDPAAVFVADNLNELRNWFLLPELGSALARGLSDKKQMYFLARRHNIPTPETVFPTSRNDVLQFIERAQFPVMLKGIDGFRLWRRTGKKMFIVSTKEELLERFDASDDPDCPNLMIQEYIPGGDDAVWMFNGYFNRNSDCLLALTGKKLRQCPIHTGATSLGICLRNDEIERTTRQFMKAVGYQGILDIGFRYDPRDGQYKVLDINPRVGATFQLFTDSNGMDVVRALYLDMTGQEVHAGQPIPGRTWLVEDSDLVSAFRYRREGSLSIRRWLASLPTVTETAYLAKDDLLPLLPLSINRSVELGRRIAKRLLSTRKRASSTRQLAHLYDPPTSLRTGKPSSRLPENA